MKRPRVVNFGSLNIDHVYRVRAFARPGETVVSSGYERFCGGKGLNQSIALANAGAQVFHAGRVGSDGRRLVDKLIEHEVNVSLVEVIDEPTGHAVIQVDSSGQNSIVVQGGANFTLSPSFVARTLHHFAPTDVLVLQNGISAVEDIIVRGAAHGMRIAFTPAPLNDAIHYLPLERVHWLILNALEACQFARTDDENEAVERLIHRFPQTAIVLTLGERGAHYVSRTERYTTPARNVEAVDTTGAGDTFTGFFIASVLDGHDVQGALDRAARAAALCITRPGAAESIPTAREVDSWRAPPAVANLGE